MDYLEHTNLVFFIRRNIYETSVVLTLGSP